VADAFIATRLAGGWSGHFGDLPQGVDAGAIARRAVPALA
jgi:putative acyl-CoA dehydrogenase